MVDRGVFSRYRRQRDLTAYRRRLVASIEGAPAVRALPELLNVPIPIVDPAGTLTPLRAATARAQFVTLAGSPGSGRQLVMQQLARYLARGGEAAGRTPTLIELAVLDDGASPPAMLLAQHLDAQSPGVSWLLLIHGLEMLPAPRRAAWRDELLSLAARRYDGAVVVALPADEQPWQAFYALRIVSPPSELLGRWLRLICPAAVRAEVEEALAPGGRLHSCAQRLLEIAILCRVAPRHGIPQTRAELYDRALDELRDAAELHATSQHAPLGHPQLGRYALARRIVAEGRFEILRDLPEPDCSETAVLVASAIQDSAPLLGSLWRARHRSDVTLVMGRSLIERPSASTVWVVRVASALGELARSGSPIQRERATALLVICAPLVDRALATIARSARPIRRLLTRLLCSLPQAMALPRAEELAYDELTSAPQAWAAADLLARWGGQADLAPRAAPARPDPLARWAYVHAMGGAAARRALDERAAATLGRSAAGAARVAAAGVALLEDAALPLNVRLAGLELLCASGSRDATHTIERAAEQGTPEIRSAAVLALGRIDPHRAHHALLRAARDRGAHWAARLDALAALASLPEVEHGQLLLESALDPSLPLYARTRLTRALGPRAGNDALTQIVAGDAYPIPVRVAAAGCVDLRDPAALDAQLAAVERDGSPPLLQAVIIEHLASGAALAPGVAQVVSSALRRAVALFALPVAHAAVRALGRAEAHDATAALEPMVGSAVLDEMLRRLPAALVDMPASQSLLAAETPPELRLSLATTLARGLTPADRPTTLREHLLAESDRLRASAARALGVTGGSAAAAALRQALRERACEATAAAAAGLAASEGCEALGDVLAEPETPQAVRWQIVQQLAREESGEPVLRAALLDERLDPFTRGAVAEALGRRASQPSLLALSRLARDPDGDQHVRAQAIAALGMLDEPAAEVVLLRLFADMSNDDRLRGRAAEALPQNLSDEGRRALREALRAERPAPMVAAGALRALGRSRDRESLPLALRYCLDEHPAVVRAAIGALADIGEETVTPVLARVAHGAGVDPVVRVQAAGALLRLGGWEHRLLMRPYLTHSSPLIQLRALDELHAAGAPAVELAELAADRERSLPLRLRALEQIASEPAAADTLLELVGRDDELQLRCQAAIALGSLAHAAAVERLAALAEDERAHEALRYRSIEALGRIGGTGAWEALGRAAEARSGTVAVWVAQTLSETASEAER